MEGGSERKMSAETMFIAKVFSDCVGKFYFTECV